MIVLLLPPSYQQQFSSNFYQPNTNYQVNPQFHTMPNYLSNLQQPNQNQQSLAQNIPFNKFENAASASPSLQTNINVPINSIFPNNIVNQQSAKDQVPQNDEAINVNIYSTTTEKPTIDKTTVTPQLAFTRTTTTPPTSTTIRGISQSKINFANFLSSPGMTSPYKLKSRFNHVVSPITTSMTTTTEKILIPTTTERILEFRPVQKKSLLNNKSRTIQRLVQLEKSLGLIKGGSYLRAKRMTIYANK